MIKVKTTSVINHINIESGVYSEVYSKHIYIFGIRIFTRELNVDSSILGTNTNNIGFKK